MAGAMKTILVVDDSPTNARLLGEMLRDDYDVRVASSGAEALALCAADPLPDLILLDVIMPSPDGYEVCRRLMGDTRTAGIPVIFISAMDDEGDRVRGLACGAVDYILKPFDPADVRARITRLLST